MGRGRSIPAGPQTDRHGALRPLRGFSRAPGPNLATRKDLTRWRSHDGLLVISSLEHAELPGSGQPPQIGPQWLVSVSVSGQDRRATDTEVARVVEAFGMPAWDEDNHHPGVARHLWCPLDARYQQACECKATEVVVTEPDGYQWTTEAGDCRGCEFERMTGRPCPIHRQPSAPAR